jgi:integrase
VVPVEAIIPGTMALLRAWRLASPRSADADPVLVNAAGMEPRPEFYSRRFATLCKSAGVPVFRLHATRHSAADLLLSKGMPMVDWAALLGHTVDVLLDRYGRSTPGGVQAVAGVFAQAVSE